MLAFSKILLREAKRYINKLSRLYCRRCGVVGGAVALLLAGRTSDRRVTSSTPSFEQLLSRNNLGKLFTYVPLSPKQYIWYSVSWALNDPPARCTAPYPRSCGSSRCLAEAMETTDQPAPMGLMREGL